LNELSLGKNGLKKFIVIFFHMTKTFLLFLLAEDVFSSSKAKLKEFNSC